MDDRLKKLQRDISEWDQKDDCQPNSTSEGGDIEMGKKKVTRTLFGKKKKDDVSGTAFLNDIESTPSQSKHMKQFFENIEMIQSNIGAITEATNQIAILRDRAVLATSEAEESKISDNLQAVVEGTNSRAKSCKILLGFLKNESDELRKEGKTEPTDLRVRDNLVNTLLNKFVDEAGRYQSAQQEYTAGIKKKATHQIQMIKPNATDEEVDEIMRSEGGREALYKQQLLTEGRVSDKIKTQYHAVAGKYQDLVRLEESVAELHQMLLDFALLTEQQGDILDDIEYQVRGANIYVEKGNEDIHDAIQIQKKLRKKHCWLILIVLVLCIVLLFGMNIFG